jgi:hypothetical protein
MVGVRGYIGLQFLGFVYTVYIIRLVVKQKIEISEKKSEIFYYTPACPAPRLLIVRGRLPAARQGTGRQGLENKYIDKIFDYKEVGIEFTKP